MRNKQIWIFLFTLALVVVSIVTIVKVPTKQGLDIAGGTRLVLEAQTDKLAEGDKWGPEKLQAVLKIIERRVNTVGVSEPIVQPKGEKQIIVELPDVDDPEEAEKTLKSTAQMEFRYFQNVKSDRHKNAPITMDVEPDNAGNDVYVFTDKEGNDVPAAKILGTAPLIITGRDLKPNSQAQKDPYGKNYVAIEFNRDGRKAFADFTRRHVGDYLAIILDNEIISAPVIRTAILDGKAIIEGGFKDVQEATRLAELLNAGALPVPLEVVQKQTVEASLGKDSVDKSVRAGLIGVAILIVYMIGYYLLPGLLADIALIIYALLTMAIFKAVPVTLTLPGIAAYILSIGMAVDANVLIFERLKEELRNGKTLRAAIDAGFSRAFTSIFDSNMCTAITCAILWVYGTGPIKGFATVLFLGVAVSMFTAITVTRSMLYLLVNTGMATNPKWFGLGRQWVSGKTGHGVEIVGRMYLWFAISALFLAPGLYYWLGAGTLHKGIDFTGGSMMQLEFKRAVTRAEVQGVLDGIGGLEGSMVQKSTEDDKVVFVRTKHMSAEKIESVKSELKSKIGDFEMPSLEQVGPTISRELTANAVKAVLFASIAIVLYLTGRFAIYGLAYGFRFGVCAVLALLHDVGIVIGAFAIFGKFFGWEIDSLFITALLTIIGFSVHDTIVVFDRIRENLRHRARGETFDGLVNKSIVQTFARSINTSLTVLITLAALQVFGAPVTSRFVAALLIGIFVGTYSSIFVASQFLVLWNRFTEKGRTPAIEERPMVASANGGGVASIDTGTIESAESKAKSAASKKRRRRF
ncbi:MAG: protein translocase subunit SecD [Armatimonadetes bacterium]|nr:protein translocase subunit SecD [Armatimonadota bacterium]